MAEFVNPEHGHDAEGIGKAFNKPERFREKVCSMMRGPDGGGGDEGRGEKDYIQERAGAGDRLCARQQLRRNDNHDRFIFMVLLKKDLIFATELLLEPFPQGLKSVVGPRLEAALEYHGFTRYSRTLEEEDIPAEEVCHFLDLFRLNKPFLQGPFLLDLFWLRRLPCFRTYQFREHERANYKDEEKEPGAYIDAHA